MMLFRAGKKMFTQKIACILLWADLKLLFDIFEMSCKVIYLERPIEGGNTTTSHIYHFIRLINPGRLQNIEEINYLRN